MYLLLFAPAFAFDLLEGVPSWTYTGSATEPWLGYQAAGGLDLDADGNGEIAVGVPFADTGAGRVLVFETSAGVLPATATWTLRGSGYANFGRGIGATGDVTGDQVGDLLVGAPTAGTVSDQAGAVYLFSGDRAGIGTTADWSVAGAVLDGLSTSIVGLRDADNDGYGDFAVNAPSRWSGGYTDGGVDLYRGTATTPVFDRSIVPPVSGIAFGADLAFGDIDADGLGDLAVGAIYSDYGNVYVYAGTGAGVDPSVTWQADGVWLGAQLGYAVDIGDLNGDGYGDLVAAAPFYDSEAGRVDIWSGGPDGVDQTRKLSELVPSGVGGFGAALAVIGDADGDGYNDLAVGEPNVHRGPGRLHVYPGSAIGPDATDETLRTRGVADDAFGYVVNAVGDLGGDGYADVLVATPEMMGPYIGVAMVYDGKPRDGDTTETGADDTGPADTDTPTDSDTPPTDDTAPGDTDTPGDGTGRADTADKDGGAAAGCGCATSRPDAAPGAALAGLLLLGLARARVSAGARRPPRA